MLFRELKLKTAPAMPNANILYKAWGEVLIRKQYLMLSTSKYPLVTHNVHINDSFMPNCSTAKHFCPAGNADEKGY